MKYRVRFTPDAEADLIRLYEFVLDRDDGDWTVGERAPEALKAGIRALEFSPFTCRKATPHSSFLRELLIPLGHTGFVALFEVEDSKTVTVLAIRHQREDDYH